MLSIFTTTYNAQKRQEPLNEALACYRYMADEVVLVDDPWPEEFEWKFIGEQFQKGYEQAQGSWVMRMDLDYFLHERDKEQLRKMMIRYADVPALSLWKYQFIIPDRYTIKSRVVLLLNKGKYGDRIKLNAGGDLCQPSLDGKLIDPSSIPEARIPIYNYDFTWKTQDVVRKDFARFARSYAKFKGEPKWGSDERTSFNFFMKMMIGRFEARESKQIPISDHPKFIQEKLKTLAPGHFGYAAWGNLPKVSYV